MATPGPGVVIDGFRLVAPVAEGGTAFLYRVETTDRPDPGFPLLMKLPRIGRGQPAESLLAFEMEAMILPTAQGHHLPRFVAAGELTATPYIVMEWIDGTSLETIARQAPLSDARAAVLGAALADALHALHRQDVIHHDVKPANVIVRADGSAVLLDLGFAHHAHLPDLLTEERRYASGSAPYVSPEQLKGTREDPRGDLFALGAVLYELATGALPFGIPPTLRAMENRLWAAVVPPRARVAGIAPWLQEVILRCLEPDPAVRYQSAAHVAFDLRHPDQVPLTTRANHLRSPGLVTQYRRWRRLKRALEARSPVRVKPRTRVSEAPVLLVAIDTSHPEDPRHAALQEATRQLVSLHTESRVLAVSVVAPPEPDAKQRLESSASGRQLAHRRRLIDWLAPTRLPAERLSLHVIEFNDAASALLEIAGTNHVDLIILGAPMPDEAALAWWRSTASTVTARARCSVHVVRVEEGVPGMGLD